MAENALRELRSQELPIAWHLASAALGSAYNLEGRIADAIAVLEQGQVQVIDDALWGPMNQAHLAQAYGLVGRMKEARNAAQDAIELAQRYDARGIEAWARQILGEIHLSSGCTATGDAQEQFQRALALADQLQMRPLVAHCHAGLGRLRGKTRQKAEARRELTHARDMYRNMEMTYYLQRAEHDLSAI